MQHVAKPDDMIDCQGGQITLAGRVIHDDKSDRGIGTSLPWPRLWPAPATWAPSSSRSSLGPTASTSTFAPSALASAPASSCPAKRAACCVPSNAGSRLVHRLRRHRPGSRRHADAACLHGFDHRQRRHLSAAAHSDADQLDHGTNAARSPPHRRARSAAALPAGEDLPNPLPTGRASRHLSTLAAAQMRKMMEGVVLFGTGKEAQLNGYSSGGKTGTAQKIDPVTHLYSKTMHIASFAGFAPVNNPVIAVAVVIDSPKGASTTAPRLRAGLCGGGAAGSRISRRAARYRPAARAPPSKKPKRPI